MLGKAQYTAQPTASEGLGIEALKTLINRAYDRAKWWAGAVIWLQGMLFLTGVLAIFWPSVTLTYPWVAVPLALLGSGVSACASKFKSLAEGAKRQHEYVAGFGGKPSLRELANLRQDLKKELSTEDDNLLRLGITYASQTPYGPRRALENLSESAWYTKHLAGHCFNWVASTFAVTLFIAISVLLWLAGGGATGAIAAKGIAATFIFLISVGSIRSGIGYFGLRQKADRIDSNATVMLAMSELTDLPVQRLLTEYQVARASAPMIPTWMWKFHRKSLNEGWALRCLKP